MSEPTRGVGPLGVILASFVISACGVGCGSHQPLDPRKYFSRSDPSEAVVSLSWSVAARKWEHVADCLRVDEGAPASKEALKELADLEVHTRREATAVEVSPDGEEAVVTVPFEEGPFEDGFEVPNGLSHLTVHLVAREVVEGERLWVIDVPRTLAANAPRAR